MIIHTVIQDPTAHKIAEKSTAEVEGSEFEAPFVISDWRILVA